jgi:hypothetical protein
MRWSVFVKFAANMAEGGKGTNRAGRHQVSAVINCHMQYNSSVSLFSLICSTTPSQLHEFSAELKDQSI